MPSAYFDMAIDHFWRAQNASSDLDCMSQTATGVQQLVAAMQESTSSSDAYYPMAIDHLWTAQNATTVTEGASQMASGLQQFCAALKNQYS